MPNPIKTVRIPPDMREAIRTTAQQQRSNESAVIREALSVYLSTNSQKEQKHGT